VSHRRRRLAHPRPPPRGKAEFDDEIENPAFEGSPELTVDRTIDAGDLVVVPLA
jgi:hypothetical protein